MRLEGFLSLLGCVMLLFVLAACACSVVREAREVRELAQPGESSLQR